MNIIVTPVISGRNEPPAYAVNLAHGKYVLVRSSGVCTSHCDDRYDFVTAFGDVKANSVQAESKAAFQCLDPEFDSLSYVNQQKVPTSNSARSCEI